MDGLAALGVAFQLAAATAQIQSPAPIANQRYVIVQGTGTVYLLDTVTGRTWTQTIYTNLVTEPHSWKPMDQENTPAEHNAIGERYQVKPPEAATPRP